MPGQVRGIALRDWPRLVRSLGINPDELRTHTGLKHQLPDAPHADMWLPLGVQMALLHGMRDLGANRDFAELAEKLDDFVEGEIGFMGRLGLRALGVRQAYARVDEAYRYIYRELDVSAEVAQREIRLTLRGDCVRDPTWQWLQRTIHGIACAQLGEKDAEIRGENASDEAYVLSIALH